VVPTWSLSALQFEGETLAQATELYALLRCKLRCGGRMRNRPGRTSGDGAGLRIDAWIIVVALILVGLPVLAASAGAHTDDNWAALRRPLHFPRLAAGTPCPVSHVDARITWRGINIFGGQGIGRGPVYPGLGAHGGLLWATRDQQYGGPWFGDKVFWYVQPTYRGPVIIRGRRIDGRGMVRFNAGRLPAPELHIARGESVSWHQQPAGSRGVPSGVRVLTPGCYAFQIDGTSFSHVVVFTADLDR
jgi:hypothetical protein